MGMAIQDALHQSLLQEMKLTQLAKPFEHTVYTDSSSGKALASKLGLTKKSKHVQLRFLFMQDLVASGQLKLSKIPSERNPADVLTKYLQASTLHKLLPKLGVMTRAVDSKDLLSVISFDGQVSSQPTSSFFIGMLAEEPVSSQLVAARAYSRRSLPRRSLPPESQEVDQPTPRSFTWSSFRWFSVCSAALLCMPFFFQIFDFKLYGALLSGMMVAVQLCFRISFVLEQVASRTRTAATALRTLSSVALGSLRTPKSLIRIFLVSFSLGWAALLVQNKTMILSASFAQRDSFESSLPSLCLSSFCVAASSPASQRASTAASSMSFSSPASDRASSAASSMSITHEQAMAVLLNNEAYSLPPALLKHSLSANILNQELQPLNEKLEPQLFQQFIPKLGESEALKFWLVMQESALTAFKASGYDILPPQKASSRNANLGNWQLSSSPAKQISFFAWRTNRHGQLGAEPAYMVQDCQLVFWGELAPEASQPSLQKLHVKVAPYIFKMQSFDSMDSLFTSSCFDWGGASSAWQLSPNWKLDAQVHKHVYQKLVEELGAESALGKLIQAQLDHPASSDQAAASKESPSLVAFWKATSKMLAKNLRDTLVNVEQLVEGQEAEAFFAEAWEDEEPEPPAVSASASEKAGRLDGSENSLQSGAGNLPLNLKLEFARALGNFKPWSFSRDSFSSFKEALEAACRQQSLQLHSQFGSACSLQLQMGSFSSLSRLKLGRRSAYSFEPVELQHLSLELWERELSSLEPTSW